MISAFTIARWCDTERFSEAPDEVTLIRKADIMHNLLDALSGVGQ
ncbi:MAG TPA: hypothetical protein VIX17_29190 [Pyrinomonadaceae bacterium]|jgi:hypothetical protein